MNHAVKISAKISAIWLVLVIAGAAAVHVLAVRSVPNLVMTRAMEAIGGTGLATDGKGGVNVMIHPALTTDKDRVVVRPSPDLAYSICILDLSQGPVRIRVATGETYASLAIYADNTDNIFVLNDREAVNGMIDITVIHERMASPEGVEPDTISVVRSPSAKALALVRRVVENNAHFAAMQPLRQASSCTPL